MTDAQSLKKSLVASAENLRLLSENESFSAQFLAAVSAIVASYKQEGCLFVAGNGGSAADAQHMVAELVSKLDRDRTPIRAFALTVDTSILTAIGNDYGYDYTFERQVRGLVRKKDVLLLLTTSGNSKNILMALKAAREMGVKTILLTGRDGGVASRDKLADLEILVNGKTTAQIQEAHIVTYHLLCDAIEKALVEAKLCEYR